MRRSITFLLTMVLVTALSRAQGPTGEITGTVVDPTGAVVAGAAVTVTNPSTNTQRVVRTNSSGIYDVPALMPGNYNLRAAMAGFTTQVRSDIELQVAQVARIDFTLQLGNVTEVVEVAGGAPVLQTETTDIGTVVENRRIEDLPLNGRNYLQLTSLIPGATTNGPPAAQGQGCQQQQS